MLKRAAYRRNGVVVFPKGRGGKVLGFEWYLNVPCIVY